MQQNGGEKKRGGGEGGVKAKEKPKGDMERYLFVFHDFS